MKDSTLALMEDVLVNSLVEVKETDDVKDKTALMKEVTGYASVMNAIRETDLKADDAKERTEIEKSKAESTERIEHEKAFPWKKMLLAVACTGAVLFGQASVQNAFNIQGYTFEKDNYIKSGTFKMVLNGAKNLLSKPTIWKDF